MEEEREREAHSESESIKSLRNIKVLRWKILQYVCVESSDLCNRRTKPQTGKHSERLMLVTASDNLTVYEGGGLIKASRGSCQVNFVLLVHV